jgi:hypothetical protein
MEVTVRNNGSKEVKFFFSEIAARQHFLDEILSFVDAETEETYFQDAKLGIIEGVKIRDGFNTVTILLTV